MLSKRMRGIETLLILMVEYLLVYTIMVPFNYQHGHNPWLLGWPLAGILILMSALFGGLARKVKRYPMLLYFVITLACIGLGYWWGMTIFAAVGTAFLLFWRLSEWLEGTTKEMFWKIFSATFGFGIAYDFLLKIFVPHFPERSLFVLLPLIQVFLIVASYLLTKEVRGGNHVLTASYGIVLAGALAAGGLLVLIGPYLGWLLVKILLGLFLVAYFIVDVVMKGILFLLPTKHGAEGAKPSPPPDNPLLQSDYKDVARLVGDPHGHLIIDILSLIFLVIIGVVVVLLIRHRRFSLIRKNETKPIIMRRDEKDKLFSMATEATLVKPVRPPKNAIRLSLYQLQKKLSKGDHQRRAPETLNEWLARLPIHSQSKQIVQSVYEKVRYGERSINAQELSDYKQAIAAIYRQLQHKKKP
ncbi:hypothetical protein GCM10011391_15770 [Pullulanibacillus camelliae]|uniref:DUF4129 domain-containing protein n=1 Tax=Pullulanibacillus camelliae TaxID=1707096 RepID=A0A8J2VUA0_9BACL|nr:hypothetical protein [Pullulanibacillus camelliae]GGE37787.1 hypothetical protein GCM10011391_15770 [Pullulanibacillus camelliae]